jgi:hypothetical protein
VYYPVRNGRKPLIVPIVKDDGHGKTWDLRSFGVVATAVCRICLRCGQFMHILYFFIKKTPDSLHLQYSGAVPSLFSSCSEPWQVKAAGLYLKLPGLGEQRLCQRGQCILIYAVFPILYSPPSHRGSVCLLPVISQLLLLKLAMYHGCGLADLYDWRGFVGPKTKTSLGFFSIQSSLFVHIDRPPRLENFIHTGVSF